MKRRSLFKTIASIAGFNILARHFSVTETHTNVCHFIDQIFKDNEQHINDAIIKRVEQASNAYWGRVRETGK